MEGYDWVLIFFIKSLKSPFSRDVKKDPPNTEMSKVLKAILNGMLQQAGSIDYRRKKEMLDP